MCMHVHACARMCMHVHACALSVLQVTKPCVVVLSCGVLSCAVHCCILGCGVMSRLLCCRVAMSASLAVSVCLLSCLKMCLCAKCRCICSSLYTMHIANPCVRECAWINARVHMPGENPDACINQSEFQHEPFMHIHMHLWLCAGASSICINQFLCQFMHGCLCLHARNCRCGCLHACTCVHACASMSPKPTIATLPELLTDYHP
jgi:hypothetical protein